MSRKRSKKEYEGMQPKHPARTKSTREAVKGFEPRTDGQFEYMKLVETHPIVLAIGPAGTGKTFLAVVAAVQGLVSGKYDKIVLTRPAVEAAGEKLGSLPGDEKEKIFPHLRPLYDSLEKILGKVTVDRLVDLKIIEILPLAYMRGYTLENAFVIMDEGQNASTEQFKMLLTRLGKYSKLVATGDLNQSDMEIKKIRNGLEDAVLRFCEEDEIAVAQLGMDDIQRHPLVRRIIKAYELELPKDVSFQRYLGTGKICEVVAHRGASGEYPENTAIAFEEAIKQEADRIEFDVQITTDDVPVVCHGPVCCTYHQLSSDVLTLEEAITVCGDFPINIHVKDRRCLPFVVQALKPNTVVSSNSLRDLFELQCMVSGPFCEFVCDKNYRKNIPLAARYHCSGINVPVEDIDPWLINGSYLYRLDVKAYVVNSNVELEQLIQLGITGVFTDFPARLR